MMGISGYEHFVSDGRTNDYGHATTVAGAHPAYMPLVIAKEGATENLQKSASGSPAGGDRLSDVLQAGS